MTGYIKREDVLKAINMLRPENTENHIERAINIAHDFIEKRALSIAHDFIESGVNLIPAADVRENKHGEWIEKPINVGTPETDYFCSECNWASWRQKTKFCPNCGADMRGEKYG